ncbi:MAG: tyrosine-type recombinase/integrase [Candidatus Methanoperedens sp.]|nr:tyrosine-type recombinase/integrase [Candidatus Methanoperedens sp.]
MSIDIKDFLEDCRSRNLTNKTIATYKSNVTEYLRFVQNPLNVDTLKLRNFLDYLKNDLEYKIGKVAKKGVCPKTLNAYFSAIRTYYDYLVYTRQIDNNPVLPFRQRYLSRIKEQHNGENTRQLISIEDMIQLVTLDMAILDRAILMILAKTGVRRGELIAIDRENLDLEKKEIILKPKAKRTNRLVFFDDETVLVLRAYLEWRNKRTKMKALFISPKGFRINRDDINQIVARHGSRLGLHDPEGSLNKKLTPHCFRHWFTTHLRRNEMPREFIQELRGDRRTDAIDIYDHIDLLELKERYSECIPKLLEVDQRVTVSPGSQGVTVRPDKGVTVRPDEGVTVRPDEGVTVRPDERVTVRPDERVTVKQDQRGKHKHDIYGFSLTLYEYVKRHEGLSTASISKYFFKNKDYVKQYLYRLKDYGLILNDRGNWYPTSKKPIAETYFINSTERSKAVLTEGIA